MLLPDRLVSETGGARKGLSSHREARGRSPSLVLALRAAESLRGTAPGLPAASPLKSRGGDEGFARLRRPEAAGPRASRCGIAQGNDPGPPYAAASKTKKTGSSVVSVGEIPA